MLDREVDPASPRGQSIQEAGACFGCLAQSSLGWGVAILVVAGVLSLLGSPLATGWWIAGAVLATWPVVAFGGLAAWVAWIQARDEQ